MKKTKTKYPEPTDFIPKEIRKEMKIGEYDDTAKKGKKDNKERSVSNEEFRKYLNSED